MVNAQSSAAGIISLLHDPDVEIQAYAIEELDAVVASHWAEISESIADIEALSESTSPLSPESRQLASLLASKLYFYLGSLDEAVDAALSAGQAFNRQTSSVTGLKQASVKEYQETVTAQCLDRAIAQSSTGELEDERLKRVVENVLEASMSQQEKGSAGSKLSIGLTLSLRRLDLLEQVYLQSKSTNGQHDEDLLRYVLSELTSGSGGNESWGAEFREDLLHLLYRLFTLSSEPDYTSISQIWLQLSDITKAATSASAMLQDLIKQGKKLQAYQVAFDLAEGGGQDFLRQVGEGLGQSEDDPTKNLSEILSGEKSIRLNLEFLQKNNHTDLKILKNTKDALEARHSIYHSAVTFMNAFANAGTSSDQFLRENLEWLGRASNWSMFSATAALGVIHQGSLAQAMTVLGPYLPQGEGAGAVESSPYSEGGSLYALGLINAGHGQDAVGYLLDKLRGTTDETVQHGAALGLGISGLASQDENTYDALRDVLFQDSSVAGEAAAYAMGLVMLGSASEKALDEMLQYAHETQHEKIIRGLSVGIAFLMYGKGQAADDIIERLLAEKDSLLRYGGMYTLALAYAGTGNNQAIRKLLQVAVSDANDDVRRAAVTALGFVMFNNHTQVPRVVQLLSGSYNPHVRHGATLALGISCAGTALPEAIEILEPMTKDPIDFVRQGALISLSMILVQQNEAQTPKAKTARDLFEKTVSDNYEDSLAKFGAAISQGIIDAGGRNVTISLQTKAGTPNMKAIVGMTLFSQFWYWFPLAHCLSLSFQPTGIIGLDETLQIPKFEFVSNAKPSHFAYPAAWAPPKKETVEKVKTAVLSTTARANARAKAREQEKAAAEGEAMETDEPVEEKEKEESSEDKKEEDKVVEEPSMENLGNLSRVTPVQLAHISFPHTARYQPVRPVSSSPASQATPRKGRKASSSSSTVPKALSGGGIIMLRDTMPDNAKEYIQLNAALDKPVPAPAQAGEGAAEPDVAAAQAGVADMHVDDSPEAEMPASFEYPFGTPGA